MKTLLVLTLIAGALANPKYPEICGKENKTPSGERIVGGQEAARNQFPWVATAGLCTGSVLDENWVITAKHCVNVDGTAIVLAGVHDRSDESKEPHLQKRISKEIYVSPLGDFALIKVPKPFEFNEYVRPVCLPTRADIENTFIGVNATLTGWGTNGFDPHVNYPELHFFKNIPVVKCGFADNILCTDANNGVAVCFGDSGGPINYEFEDGKYMQIGVNQFVTNHKCLGGVNGYARLTTHLDFIQETTGIVIE